MHGYFFSDKPLKLETNMYIEPQFFLQKYLTWKKSNSSWKMVWEMFSLMMVLSWTYMTSIWYMSVV